MYHVYKKGNCHANNIVRHADYIETHDRLAVFMLYSVSLSLSFIIVYHAFASFRVATMYLDHGKETTSL